VYMWHVPLLLFGRSLGVFPHPYALRVVVLLVPVLLVAAASWYLVERPAIAWAGRAREADRRAHERDARTRERNARARHAAPSARDRDARTRQAQLEAHAAP
jgi:peptidoglycan/LPS O-acetylase OafA/YrhL